MFVPHPPSFEVSWSLPGHSIHSTAEDGIDTGKDEFQSTAWDLANAICEDLLVERDGKRDIRHGILRQARFGFGQQDVPRGVRPLEIARQGHAKYRGNAAAINGVALNDEDRPSISGLGPGGLFEVRPPDLGLFDYHSTRRRACRAARSTKGAFFSPTVAMA